MRVYVITKPDSRTPLRDFLHNPKVYSSKKAAVFGLSDGEVMRVAELTVKEITK